MRARRATVALLLALPAALGLAFVAVGVLSLADGWRDATAALLVGTTLIAIPVLIARRINARVTKG